MLDKNKVKNVKLAINPTTTPIGLFFPESVDDEDKIIGRIGRIQGESMVTIPAKKAKAINNIIATLSWLIIHQFHHHSKLPMLHHFRQFARMYAGKLFHIFWLDLFRSDQYQYHCS